MCMHTSDCNDVLCHETGVLEMIDLSNNLLTGQVPSEFGQFCGFICISGWKYKHVRESVSYHSCTVNMLTPSIYFHQLHLLHFNRSTPAPLSLCSIPGFDLRNKDMIVL